MSRTVYEARARENQSLDFQIIWLLDSICTNLEITPAMFKTAEERYISITDYLDEPTSPLRPYRPIIYPQGSVNLETTVKPIGELEFDVDVICMLDVPDRMTQAAFLDLIYNRLKQRGCYTLKRMNRCVRVQYANEFHIDITPGIPDHDIGPENILVTDKQLGRWKESNSKDYATWFRDIARISPQIRYESRELMEKHAAVEPLPPLRFNKPALNRIVQLAKRHRDQLFKGRKQAPISAIITTLIAHSYHHNATRNVFDSQVEFIRAVIAEMPNFFGLKNGIRTVANPRNHKENYADKWPSNPDRSEAFDLWHAAAVKHFDSLLSSKNKGKDALFESLSASYGNEVVKQAAIVTAERRKLMTDSKDLGVLKGTGIIAPTRGAHAASKVVIPVRPHTFFGI